MWPDANMIQRQESHTKDTTIPRPDDNKAVELEVTDWAMFPGPDSGSIVIRLYGPSGDARVKLDALMALELPVAIQLGDLRVHNAKVISMEESHNGSVYRFTATSHSCIAETGRFPITLQIQ